MWFDDEDVLGRRFGKRKKGSRQKQVLNVNLRANLQKGSRLPGAASLVIGPTVLLALALLLWFGGKFARELLFSRNDRYTIRSVDIHVSEGAVIGRDLIREYTRIVEGTNIFSFNIAQIRRDVMQTAPNIRYIRIHRILPDAVTIDVTERTPLARLGRWNNMAVDGEGCVFYSKETLRHLPTINGHGRAGIKPGDYLDGLALAALQVISLCNEHPFGLEPNSINIEKGDRLVLNADYRGKDRAIKLLWPGMGQNTAEAREALISRLATAVQAFESPDGRNVKDLDLTYAIGGYGKQG